MIASVASRFVFLHLPKNAGTAIHQSISEAFSHDKSLVEGWGIENGIDLAHPMPAVLKARFPLVYRMLGEEDTRSVAVLRDPLLRCLAAFQEHRTQYWEHPAACGSLADYLDCIEEGVYRKQGGDGHVFIHGAPQHEFLFDESRLLVRNLLRLDDELFFPKLCMLAGFSLPPLQHESSSRIKGTYVSRAEVNRILRIYGKDYDLIESVPDVSNPNEETGRSARSKPF